MMLASLSLWPAYAAAQDSPPQPSVGLFDGGRLLSTAGASTIEGAAGGGLVPWAVITGYGSRDSAGANLHSTAVRLPNFTLGTVGASLGVQDRLEISYQHQWFNTGATGVRLGLGRGYTLEQDIFGGKLRLFGDVVADQDSWRPQVSIGLQHKISANGELIHALGARNASGTDVYVSATKLLLDQSLLLNGTLRMTRANQFGLLGHSGDRGNSYRPQLEASAAVLVSRHVAVGAEYRTRPDNLGFAKEAAGFDVFGAWFITKNVSLVLAYVDLGPIANQGRQNGMYLSLQAGF